jgi:hypothetical protein
VKKENPNVKNIKAKLYCSGSKSDTPLHTVKLDTVKFVIFPAIPADGNACWISVEVSFFFTVLCFGAKSIDPLPPFPKVIYLRPPPTVSYTHCLYILPLFAYILPLCFPFFLSLVFSLIFSTVSFPLKVPPPRRRVG